MTDDRIRELARLADLQPLHCSRAAIESAIRTAIRETAEECARSVYAAIATCENWCTREDLIALHSAIRERFK